MTEIRVDCIIKILKTAVLTIACILSASGLLTLTVYAGTEGNVFFGSAEAVEIFDDWNLILEDLPDELTEKDLDFDMIIRVYHDVNIFEHNIKSAGDMRTILKNADYIYHLPVFTEKCDYDLYISRGGYPVAEGGQLSDEEVERINKRAEKWSIPGYGIAEEETDPHIDDYRAKMEVFFSMYGIKNSETFFIGGATDNSSIIAICFTDEGTGNGSEPYYIALDNLDINAKSMQDIGDVVYSYDEMKKFDWSKAHGFFSPGSMGPVMLIIAVIIAALSAAIILFQKRKHSL